MKRFLAIALTIAMVFSLLTGVAGVRAADLGMHITSPIAGGTITTSTFNVNGTFDAAQTNSFKLLVTVAGFGTHTYNFAAAGATTWSVAVNMADFPGMVNNTAYATTLQGATQMPSIPPVQSDPRAVTWQVQDTLPATMYTIAATAGTGGTIAPSGSVSVNQGSSQTFTISANTGYHIANVTVDGVSLGPMSSYAFEAVQSDHTITVTVVSAGPFSVTADAGVGGRIEPSGIVAVAEGGTATFLIEADANSHIAGVRVDGIWIGLVSSYSFTSVTANHTIEATFAADAYVVTASAGANGSISPSGAVTVDKSASQSFTITPDAGYHVADVVIDGASVGAVISYTVTNAQANHTIRATFALDAKKVIELKIGSTRMLVDGSPVVLEAAPIILNSRTLLPIRAVVEAVGGTIAWEASTRKVTIKRNSTTLDLWIGWSRANLNGQSVNIDNDPKVVPVIVNGRTLLPLRFVSEALALDVQWDAATKVTTITFAP
jgi:hypothetical protein